MQSNGNTVHITSKYSFILTGTIWLRPTPRAVLLADSLCSATQLIPSVTDEGHHAAHCQLLSQPAAVLRSSQSLTRVERCTKDILTLFICYHFGTKCKSLIFVALWFIDVGSFRNSHKLTLCD